MGKANATNATEKAKSLCQGCASILSAVEQGLLRFIFESREQGMSVSITMVMLRAAHLSQQFEKSQGMHNITLHNIL